MPLKKAQTNYTQNQTLLLEKLELAMQAFSTKYDFNVVKPVIFGDVPIIAETSTHWIIEKDMLETMSPDLITLFILHEICHYYVQGTRSYDEAKAIRADFGFNYLSEYDICGDRMAYIMWRDTFNKTLDDYLVEMWSTQEYKDGVFLEDGFSRFFGSILTIFAKEITGLDVIIFPRISSNLLLKITYITDNIRKVTTVKMDPKKLELFVRYYPQPNLVNKDSYLVFMKSFCSQIINAMNLN